MLVGRIVVDDGVDRLFDGDLRLDRIEEADELLVAMALHVTANDSAIEDVEGCERCTERRLTPAALASIRPVQWVASPGGGPSVSSTTLCTVVVGSNCLPGLRVLSRVSPATPSAMNRGLRLARSAHDLGGAAAAGRREDDVGPPYVLLRRAAIRDDRLKPSAIRSGNVHDNSCSHGESLNCFGQFGNCPNESAH